MGRLLVIPLLLILLLLAWTSVAMATEEGQQITIGGEMRMRGRYINNISTTDSEPVETDSYAWYDSRIRLYVDAKVSPGLQGYLMLESGEGQNANYNWGNFNSKPSGLSIIEAWILYKGLGLFRVPAGLKIGHMFLSLGERQFLDHTKFGDDAIVFSMDTDKRTHIELIIVKFREGDIADNGDDYDAYIGTFDYRLNDNNTLRFDYTYLNDSEMKLGFHNVGVHANGVIVKNLSYVASADIQFGKVDSDGDSEKEKFSGYGLLLKLGYKINDNFKIRASFAMGSGDDDLNDDNHKEFQTTRLYRNETPLYSYVYETQTDTAWMDQVFDPGSRNRGNGIANTTYYNLGFDISPMKNLYAFIDGYILRATETGAFPNGSSSDMGWEIDGKLEYTIAKNLIYYICGGYLEPGKGYEDSGKVPDGERKGATVVRHGIILKF